MSSKTRCYPIEFRRPFHLSRQYRAALTARCEETTIFGDELIGTLAVICTIIYIVKKHQGYLEPNIRDCAKWSCAASLRVSC